MSKINCLLQNTKLYEDFKDAIRYYAAQQVQQGKSIKIKSLYPVLRKNKYEVDMQTFGIAYQQAFESVADDMISTNEDISKWSGKPYKKALASAVKKAEAVQRVIGDLSPSQAIIGKIANMFGELNKSPNEVTTSLQKSMEDILSKWVSNNAEKTKKEKKDIVDVLQDYFNVSNSGFETNIKDTLNTLGTLRDDIKGAMQDVIDSINSRGDLSEEQKEQKIFEYEEFIEPLLDSIDDIVLSDSEKSQLLNKVLANNGLMIDGESIANKNGGISWNKLLGDSGVTSKVEAAFRQMLNDGFKNENGDSLDLTNDQKEILVKYFGRIYAVKRNDALQARAQRLMDVEQRKEQREIDKLAKTGGLPQMGKAKIFGNKKPTTAQLIGDFLKDLGNLAIGTDAKGIIIAKTEMEYIRKMLLQDHKNGTATNEKSLMQAFDKYLAEKYPNSTEESRKYTNSKFKEKLGNALRGKKIKRNAIDRLGLLMDIQGGKAFGNDTNDALLKVLQVPELSQETIKKVAELNKQLSSMMGNTNISPSKSLRQSAKIQAQINLLVERNITNKPFLFRLFNLINAYSKVAYTSLLLSTVGIVENVITAQFTNAVTGTRLAAKGGATLRSTIDLVGGFFIDAFSGALNGGGQSAYNNDIKFRNILSSSERYNIANLIYEFKNGNVGNGIEQLFGIIPTLVTTASNIFLASMDAGFTQASQTRHFKLQMYNKIKDLTSKEEAIKVLKGLNGIKNHDILKD